MSGETMGLNAAVYSDDDDEHEITSVRIGNTAGVGYLAQAIEAKFPEATVILGKVLYSGSHCGDHLSRADVRQAQRELAVIQAKIAGDLAIEEFVANFGLLIEVALCHDRPITF